jgi:hypothetical protein
VADAEMVEKVSDAIKACATAVENIARPNSGMSANIAVQFAEAAKGLGETYLAIHQAQK